MQQPMNVKPIHGCYGDLCCELQALKQGPKTRLSQDAQCGANYARFSGLCQ